MRCISTLTDLPLRSGKRVCSLLVVLCGCKVVCLQVTTHRHRVRAARCGCARSIQSELFGQLGDSYAVPGRRPTRVARRIATGSAWHAFRRMERREQLPMRCRSYLERDDFKSVSDFLVNHYQPNNADGNWLQPAWDYMHGHPYLNRAFLNRIGVWESSAGVVGVVHYESELGEAFIQKHRAFSQLWPEFLHYAEHNLFTTCSLGENTVRVYINGADLELEALAASVGYRKDSSGARPTSVLLLSQGTAMAAALPEGYKTGCLSENLDFLKLRRVLWRGFDHPGEPPNHDSDTIRQTVPRLNADTTIVATAPNGDFAAICGTWYEPKNKIAYVEPVATDRDHRLRGLGKAVVIEGLERCRRLGAKVAFVGSDQAFYQSMGFKLVNTAYGWTKTWKA
jgi:GNAT superfamily N-acetyltransferase